MEIENVFVFDTETTGQKGVPLWNDKNRVIQICAYHPHSGEMFMKLISYGPNFYIAPDNISIHKITPADLEASGEPPKEVLMGFLDFIEKNKKGRPWMVAHSATFDHNVIRKMLYLILDRCYGRGGVELEWDLFCSLRFFRSEHPDLELITEPKDKPYALGSLCERFLGEKPEGLHNAAVDVKMLARLFLEIIVPSGVDLTKYLVTKSPYESVRMTKLRQVPYYAEYRTNLIADQIRNAFALQADQFPDKDYRELIHPDGLFTVAHVMIYGKMRYLQTIKNKKTLTAEEKCEWYEICRHVELLLRSPPINLSCDATIAALVCFVAEVDIVDLMFHTMRENGNTNFFPTQRGLPIAFMPAKVTEHEARLLESEAGWGSISEMVADYKVNGRTIGAVVQQFNNLVAPDLINQSQTHNLGKIIEDFLEYCG